MYRIVRKEALKPTVILYEIEAPMVARKAEPGQFIILRVDELGERIPITIHDFDREKGTVTIIVQTVGATTEKLSHKQEGDCLQDFVGPLLPLHASHVMQGVICRNSGFSAGYPADTRGKNRCFVRKKRAARDGREAVVRTALFTFFQLSVLPSPQFR